MINKFINVVAGIIYDDNFDRFLIARKRQGLTMGGLWEFPGGKIEENEIPENALRREIFEELNIQIVTISHFVTYEHIALENSILMHVYTCRKVGNKFMLTDHDAVEWIKKEDLNNFSFPQADFNIVEKLKSL